MPSWDPTQYERFAEQRQRPFRDLLSRIRVESPRLIVDLGCGNGLATVDLAQRWPQARVIGLDSSADMLDRARTLEGADRIEWMQEDVTRWDPTGVGAPDVIVTNATLQWVPGHLELIPQWLDALAPGGVFAMQVPGNFDAPSHRVIREVAAEQPRGAELTAALRHNRPVFDPQEYAEVLATVCPHLDVWETTYLQVLDPQAQQECPVLEWVKGTVLRPLLDLLEGAEREVFIDQLTRRLEEAYPRQSYGTPFPFRRIFAVGQKATLPRVVEPSEALAEDESKPGDIQGNSTARIQGLHHVQLACPAHSEETLSAFYTGVLGLPEIAKPPALAARGGCWFEVGPQQLHLGVEADFRPAKKAHPCVLVDDVDAVADVVAAAGGDVRWDQQIEGVRRFHTDDPVGNRLEIQQS